MTALVFVIQPDQVCFAMDTLIVTHDDKMPLDFQRKFYALPENNIVVAGTGLGNLVNTWFEVLGRLPTETNIDDLAPIISELVQKLLPFVNGIDLATSTLYHFGYSKSQAKYVGFVSRSENNWKTESIQENAIGFKPIIPLPECNDIEFPDYLVKIIQAQQKADLSLPVVDKVGIGGEIEFVHMKNGEISISNVHRFETYTNEQEYIASRHEI